MHTRVPLISSSPSLSVCPCKSQTVMTARLSILRQPAQRAFDIRLSAALGCYLLRLYLHRFRCCFPLSGAPPKPIFKYFHFGFLANCLTAAVSCCQATHRRKAVYPNIDTHTHRHTQTYTQQVNNAINLLIRENGRK